jgi:hypothetical protein
MYYPDFTLRRTCMNSTHLLCASSLIATSLLLSNVAMAQTAASTSTSEIDSSAEHHQAAPNSTDAEPLRLPIRIERDTQVQRNAPGPLLSNVYSDPRYVRISPFLGQQAVGFAPQSPPKDPQMESRFIARRTVAGILLGLSSPFLVSGIVLLADASSHPSSDPFSISGAVDAVESGLGILSFLVGAGLFIPGLVMAVTDPPQPEGVALRYKPKLHIGPGSVGVSMSF